MKRARGEASRSNRIERVRSQGAARVKDYWLFSRTPVTIARVFVKQCGNLFGDFRNRVIGRGDD
jgi:hypothetical protein